MPFHLTISQVKKGRPDLTRVIPYSTYPGCIIATPNIGFFSVQVRIPRRGMSEPQPCSYGINPRAVCVFCNHSIITVEGKRLREYKIEYDRNHSPQNTRADLCRLGTGPDDTSGLLAIKQSGNTVAVIICN